MLLLDLACCRGMCQMCMRLLKVCFRRKDGPSRKGKEKIEDIIIQYIYVPLSYSS